MIYMISTISPHRDSFDLKRPLPSWLHWHLARAWDQAKRQRRSIVKRSRKKPAKYHSVSIWDGIEFRKGACCTPPLLPPSVLCLNENRAETLAFLRTLNQKLAVPIKNGKPVQKNWFESRRGPKGVDLIGQYWDFSQVARIGTSAAVVLASEYDRARRVMGKSPVTVNIDRWGESAFRTLFQLGFFDIVGLGAEAIDTHSKTHVGNSLITSMISRENGNGLPDVSEAIRDLTSFINSSCPVPPQVLTHLNTSLGEAMINVSRHAYAPPFESTVAYVPRWWFTAEADRDSRKITAVLFDQGATIPVTLPYKERSWWEYIGIKSSHSSGKAGGSGAELETMSDVDAIKYAMRDGTTQTDELGRGKGLPQMRTLIDKYRPGKLTIVSRGGLYSYATDGGVHSSSLDIPLKGTLIEWEIEVPR